MDSAKHHLSNVSDYAPKEVFAAMLALCDPTEVIAAVPDSEESAGRTRWRAAWLTGTHLAFCEAAADLPDWDLGSDLPHGSYEVQIDAWLAPPSGVSSIGVDAARMVREMSAWHADVRVTVAVEGREPIAVPLFGEYASGYRRERCETFLHELRSRLVSAQSENRPRSS